MAWTFWLLIMHATCDTCTCVDSISNKRLCSSSGTITLRLLASDVLHGASAFNSKDKGIRDGSFACKY